METAQLAAEGCCQFALKSTRTKNLERLPKAFSGVSWHTWPLLQKMDMDSNLFSKQPLELKPQQISCKFAFCTQNQNTFANIHAFMDASLKNIGDLTLKMIAAWQFPNLVKCDPAKLPVIIGIPSLQRGAVWNAGQVELLWDSILRGFPVGALVVCDKLSSQKTHPGKHGRGWPEAEINHHLLDGQQRCNAIALGFLNALETVNDEMPPATLWIDLNPQLPKGSTRQFLFRMLTTAQPWGYMRNDAAEFLGVAEIRKAVAKYAHGKRPKITASWPHAASPAPIPFSWLSYMVFVDNIAYGDLWRSILQKCRSLPGRTWADEAAKLIESHLNGSAPSKHLERIERGLQNAKQFTLVALKVPPSALNEKSCQEEAGEENQADNGNRIYNVEHLFQRLNSAGTELRGEELMFSMIKAYWPSIEQSFDTIHDKAGNKFLPMPASRLALLGARAALIGLGQYVQKGEIPPSLSIGRIRSLAYDSTAKDQKEQLQRYLGIEREAIEEPDLHKNLRQIDEWLLFEGPLDFGLPPVLRSSLAQDAPEVFLLLLHLAQKVRSDNLNGTEIAALRKPILGLVTALHWFGEDQARAVAKLYSSCFIDGVLSPATFLGILKHCLPASDGRREMVRLLSPDALDKLIPLPSVTDENLSEWRLWNRLFEVEKDEAKRELLVGEHWQFLDKVRRSNALLLYGQRAFLNRDLSYDPSCVDIWKGHNRPWDYDHILPSATLTSNQGSFRDACREWAQTIGNLRAWPLEKNRSRHQDLAKESILPGEFADCIILDNDELLSFSLTWSDINDGVKAAGFMNAARSRMIRIYTDWFNALEIGNLIGLESDVPLPT